MFNWVLAIYVCCQQIKNEIYSNVRVISHYNTICHHFTGEKKNMNDISLYIVRKKP